MNGVGLGLCFPRPPHPSVFDVYGRLDQPTTTPARCITSPLPASRSCEDFSRTRALLDRSGETLAQVYGRKAEGFQLGAANVVDLSDHRCFILDVFLC